MSPSQTTNELVGFSPEQLIGLARTDFAIFVELMFRNCSRPGAGFGYATHGIGRPSRVRRIASMARIDRRRAVSTTDLMSA